MKSKSISPDSRQKSKQIAVMTPTDYEIFERGKTNANWITDYYMRSPTSGTRWTKFPIPYDEEKVQGWNFLFQQWKKAKKPKPKWVYKAANGEEIDYYVLDGADGDVIFFQNHGWLWMPWQLEAHHAAQSDLTIIGGFGTTDIDALVYEADLRQYVSMRWLIENNHAPTVLSKTDDGWAKVKASIPYYEGTGDMYRVSTRSGKTIDVALGHQFLTSRGFVRTLDLRLGDAIVAPDALPATILDDAEDGSAQNCLGCCSPYCSRYGERPFRYPEGDQSFAPSLTGAQKPSRSPSSDLYNPLVQARIYSLRPFGRSYVPRLPRRHSTHLLVRHALPGVPLRWREASDELVRPEWADQVLQQSEDTASQYWQDVLSSSTIDLGVTAFYDAENDHIGWSYLSDGSAQPSLSGQPLNAALSRVHQPELAVSPGSASPSSSFYPQYNGDWGDCSTFDTVTSITYIGVRDYYDLHVPLWNNYVAEGLVSHNSGKTAYIAMSLAVLAITIPNFRGYSVAPQMLQAKEVFRAIDAITEGTPWKNRFLWNQVMSPYPKFTLKSDFIGESTIELLSIADNPSKVRTLEGDIIFLDQAELIEDIDEITRDLGTRLRGQINGRPRLGKLVYVANAGDNPQLWSRYDMAELEPQTYKSMNPSTLDNIFLTKADIANIRRRASGGNQESQQAIDQWMHGKRPMGKGSHFPANIVKDCIDEAMDQVMESGLKMIAEAREENEAAIRAKRPPPYVLEQMPEYQYVKLSGHRTGVYRWELPPDHSGGRQYMVIADPGQGNPPDRNSAAIGVFDITDFPNGPARMRAFHWVHGSGSYWPFINEYCRYVTEYRAFGRNAFDSTGVQKGFDELVFANMNIMPYGMDMSGSGKYQALNALKIMMGRSLIKFPYISHLINQLTNYELPDNKLRQDLVMMMAMAASYLRRYYYDAVIDPDDAMTPPATERTRYARPLAIRDGGRRR